jgi:hypothetical protein
MTAPSAMPLLVKGRPPRSSCARKLRPHCRVRAMLPDRVRLGVPALHVSFDRWWKWKHPALMTATGLP